MAWHRPTTSPVHLRTTDVLPPPTPITMPPTVRTDRALSSATGPDTGVGPYAAFGPRT
ncbi:hypothetical protein M2283_002315 [Streptomyces pseudovenezuelae]|uniref:Uncharacterized protein n=1 Tax=Streptomyces pseudovenezuelae TaxID=67350 RepID=A0ABT6LFE7_9ACTN|nr:hypothetical protein [Streptomyces pseudovenezuelae]